MRLLAGGVNFLPHSPLAANTAQSHWQLGLTIYHRAELAANTANTSLLTLLTLVTLLTLLTLLTLEIIGPNMYHIFQNFEPFRYREIGKMPVI